MGRFYRERCKECGFEFVVKSGGGFFFHLLRCDTCGETRSVNHKGIGEPFLRYVKGLKGHYSSVTMERDEDIQANYPGEPITEEEYHSVVAEMLGKCSCGGKYRFDAPPRCERCRSAELEGPGDWSSSRKSVIMYYD